MKFTRTLMATAVVAIAIVVAGCGSDDSASTSTTDGNQVDAMFVSGMIPHHQAAIDMAMLGVKNAKHDEIKQLSENIAESQQAEIDQMNKLATQMPDAKGTMMSDQEMASMMSDVDSLREAKNFDKEFIDAMIPHHQSAVVMANQVVADGTNPDVMKLAKSIIAAQSKEIAEMQSWRNDWYGSPLPTAASSSMGSMHDGH